MIIKPIAVINYYDLEEEYLKVYPNEIRPLGYVYPLCPNDSYQILGLTPEHFEETEQWMYDLPMDADLVCQENDEKGLNYENFHARQAIIKNRLINLVRQYVNADEVLIEVSW